MIRILADHVVNRIAAGEVVERPASVVKELVENSLDAGARRVHVALRAGGTALIQVTDDGSGMSRADAAMCLERHATSKLRDFEDLDRIGTLGFRGEAIPSIAAVSELELLTRPREDELGTRVDVHGGVLRGVSPAGAPPGTRMTVRNLFFNVPARRRFLRSVATELSHCHEAVLREALARPWLDIELTHDGRTIAQAPPGPPLERAPLLLGPDAASLFEVDVADGPLRLRGLASPPGTHRGGAQGAVYLYVNGRYVRDAVLRRAIAEAWEPWIPRGRHPLVVLDLEIPTAEVDCNVHPAKVEVRFQHPREVHRFVVEALSSALARAVQPPPPVDAPPLGAQLLLDGSAAPAPRARAAPHRPDGPPGAELRAVWGEGQSESPPGLSAGPPGGQPPLGAPLPGPEGRAPLERPRPGPRPAPDDAGSIYQLNPVSGQPAPGAPVPAPVPTPLPSRVGAAPVLGQARVVGSVGGRVLVCEGPDGLILVDLPAAQDRVLAARILAAAPRCSPLPAPLPLAVDPVARAAFAAHAAALLALGVEVELPPDGGVIVRSIPDPMLGRPPEPWLRRLAAALPPVADPARALAALAVAARPDAPGAPSPYELRELLKALDAAPAIGPAAGVAVVGLDRVQAWLDRGTAP